MITMDKDLLLNKDQQKVEHVMIDSCPSVLLSLDLNSHKITNITLKITNCGNVKIVNIKYDPIFSGQQVVNIELENLDTFTLQQLEIDDALMVIGLFLCSFGNYFVISDFVEECWVCVDLQDNLLPAFIPWNDNGEHWQGVNY